MNNDDIYVRKDVYNAEQEHIITLIQNVEKQTNNIYNVIVVCLASAALAAGLIAAFFTIIQYYK